MTGIRLGMGLASVEIIEILNKIKPPYNVNTLTQEKALELLGNEKKSQEEIEFLLKERDWMLKDFLVLLSAKVYKLKEIINSLTQR